MINEGDVNGFTVSEYQAEIDGYRPMIIQVSEHSMFGCGKHHNITLSPCMTAPVEPGEGITGDMGWSMPACFVTD